MAQHKWHKEIKAWADGAEIEHFSNGNWIDCANNKPSWWEDTTYRIKPQPKEPQYLYVSQGEDGKPKLSFLDHQGCLGKIELKEDE
jgi:hypothetical protein